MKKRILWFFACLFLMFPFFQTAFATTYTSTSETVTTRVGNPPVQTGGGGCWPNGSSGPITQGPEGALDHARLKRESGGLESSVDIGIGTGTTLYATINGTVSAVHTDNWGGYGNSVEISNSTAFLRYGHLSVISVAQGAAVSVGDKIGLSGNSGVSTGPHLHWTVKGISFPQPVTPPECDTPSIPCTPTSVVYDAALCTTNSSVSPPAKQNQHWFLLHRQSRNEELYQGIPGDKGTSQLVKTFTVRPGKPGERPTPLPQLISAYASRPYWIIEWKDATTNPLTGPYFLKLDIPYTQQHPFGPEPYLECNGKQCDWQTPGDFGLHGTGGVRSRVDNDGSQDANWSSGCIRHYDEDITWIYNNLDPKKEQIRYYIEDN